MVIHTPGVTVSAAASSGSALPSTNLSFEGVPVLVSDKCDDSFYILGWSHHSDLVIAIFHVLLVDEYRTNPKQIRY